MTTLKPPPKKKRGTSETRGSLSTLDQTPHTLSLAHSRILRKKNSISFGATMGDLFKKRMDELMETPFASPSKDAKPLFVLPARTESQQQVEERLEEMREDKLHHILVKNRIRRRFFEKKQSELQGKANENTEQVYTTTQNRILHPSPKYEYLSFSGTFYSRSRRRIFDEEYQPSARTYNLHLNPEQKAGPNFFLYTSNKKHRDHFKEARKRCKTTGSSDLEMNKSEILKIEKEGSKEYRLLKEYLEEALQQR